jgi:hypothetical protein
MSASEVSKLVFGEFEVEVSKRTIQCEGAEEGIGVSPKRKDRREFYPD